MTALFLDLDGVFADFDKHFENVIGEKPSSDKIMWAQIEEYGNFFSELPLMQGAHALMSMAEVLFDDITFLTACPKTFYQKAARQKRNWVREHFGYDYKVLPVLGGKNKALFMHRAGDILVDDYAANCDSWNAEGGRSVLHKTVKATIGELYILRISNAR